jgi:hypothetical protein
MTTLVKIKNRLIDRILITKDEKLLNAIDTIFNSTHSDEKYPLDSHQIEMLLMSEQDILDGNLISAEELEKSDEKWMK